MKVARIASLPPSFALLFWTSCLHAQQDPFPLPPKEWPSPVSDTEPFTFLFVDRLEYRGQPGKDVGMWDVQGWIGGDYNKFWFKTEGEREMGGKTELAEMQALYARRISPYWYLQAGVRQETRPTPSRTSGVIAIQGLAPYWFDVEGMMSFRGGEVFGRLEAENDLLLTQRWILQPRAEMTFASSADRQRGIGRGVNHVELGLRLRYEIRRELAPYVGINWTRTFGDTTDIARILGRDTNQFSIVAGLRIWY